MITIRRSEDRGVATFDWLDSRHTFSFGHYYDPKHVGFGPLRVINEDRVAPSGGFPTHGHRDMEILSYVLDGALEHKDSIGTGSIIRPGEVQRMSAGTGIRHSEYNHSSTSPVHFLQIWIAPERVGLAPGYEQKRFDPAEISGRLRLVASRDGREDSVIVHQDVDIYASRLSGSETVSFTPRSGRRVWVQIVRGDGLINGEAVADGDGVSSEDGTVLTLEAGQSMEVLLFDLPA
jgi:redox-sensitive bicupin YhaK (pirin superfamily)